MDGAERTKQGKWDETGRVMERHEEVKYVIRRRYKTRVQEERRSGL